MTNSDEIMNLKSLSEKENLKVELKSQKILVGDARKLAYEIIALANRLGGKIFIGISDNGSLEGKGIFNIKEDKQKIDNLCYNKISPVIEYDLEYLEFEGGDVLILNIPKKKNIPHAYIGPRKEQEIKSRIYYVRTRHGIRLVTDKQLEFLFKNEIFDFESNFRILLNYRKKPFLPVTIIDVPDYVLNCINHLKNFPKNDIDRLFMDDITLGQFFIQIIPYFLINNLATIFRSTWAVKYEITPSSHLLKIIESNIKKRKIRIDQLPIPDKSTLLGSLSFDLKTILHNNFFNEFYAPEGTEILINYVPRLLESYLIFKHPNFNIEIKLKLKYSGNGAMIDNLLNLEDKNQYCIDIDGFFNAMIDFPEVNIEEFEFFKIFVNSIKNLILIDWNYDEYIKRSVNSRLISIENKIDLILEKIEKTIIIF